MAGPAATTPAIAQETTRRRTEPALSATAAETGPSAALPPAEALVPPTETRDAASRAPEAPALHRPPAAEPHRQIADAVVRTRDGQVEVVLNPVELGRVTMRLGAEGDPGHLALLVERPETLDLIRRHSEQLLRDLRDGGMAEPRLDILRQDSQGHSRGGEQQRPGADWSAPRDRPGDQAREPPPRAVASSRLDIRL